MPAPVSCTSCRDNNLTIPCVPAAPKHVFSKSDASCGVYGPHILSNQHHRAMHSLLKGSAEAVAAACRTSATAAWASSCSRDTLRRHLVWCPCGPGLFQAGSLVPTVVTDTTNVPRQHADLWPDATSAKAFCSLKLHATPGSWLALLSGCTLQPLKPDVVQPHTNIEDLDHRVKQHGPAFAPEDVLCSASCITRLMTCNCVPLGSLRESEGSFALRRMFMK